MEALAARLSHLDTEAGGTIRVVMFYDTLMRRRVDLPALTRASAALAECVVGLRLHGTGRTIRTAPDGRPPAHDPAPASTTLPITLDDEEIGTVWLERPQGEGPLDDLLLDRLSIAAAATLERYGPARTTMADPALVELVISAENDEAARARALRLLGLAVDRPLHVIAVRTPLPLDRIGTLLCPTSPVKAAPLDEVGVVLATAVDRTRLPAGTYAGIGTGPDPHTSWTHARTALRLTTELRPVIDHRELGALALLAHIPHQVLHQDTDVTSIARLARDPEDLKTLDAYCSTGSLRQAARLLHLHHSSVSRRLDQIGADLDITLTDPDGLLRAKIALTSWRLLHDRPPAP
ncbi:helix-turn-helix domain-containing protein [Nocardiopsis alba]|uniref:helix-turn-helix domain-containing protein n=1 Tax=Nocardiopsis alba TaxID=53437 RepID=UPI003811AA09